MATSQNLRVSGESSPAAPPCVVTGVRGDSRSGPDDGKMSMGISQLVTPVATEVGQKREERKTAKGTMVFPGKETETVQMDKINAKRERMADRIANKK